MKNDNTGMLIILGIIVIGLLGGFSGSGGGFGFASNNTPKTEEEKQVDIQNKISDTQRKVEDLQKQVQAEQDKKNASVYKGIVSIRYVGLSSDPNFESVELQVIGKPEKPINITGWTLTSTSSGATVKIPKSTYLFFAGTTNTEEDVYVEKDDRIIIMTGRSPNGYGMKVNKCSGYLGQFQNWNPGLNTNCPLPRNEDLSSIPRTIINDACFDYIQYFPQCRIQTETLPLNWSYECKNFIYSKINYPSCVDTHKNDKDFYLHEWRIFLKRSDPLWKRYRENIVLYDSVGKIVDTYRY